MCRKQRTTSKLCVGYETRTKDRHRETTLWLSIRAGARHARRGMPIKPIGSDAKALSQTGFATPSQHAATQRRPDLADPSVVQQQRGNRFDAQVDIDRAGFGRVHCQRAAIEPEDIAFEPAQPVFVSGRVPAGPRRIHPALRKSGPPRPSPQSRSNPVRRQRNRGWVQRRGRRIAPDCDVPRHVTRRRITDKPYHVGVAFDDFDDHRPTERDIPRRTM